MDKKQQKKPLNIDLVNYNYLISKPKKDRNLIDLMAISVLEEKYPELKKLDIQPMY